jgi:hypothetical protein
VCLLIGFLAGVALCVGVFIWLIRVAAPDLGLPRHDKRP